MKIDTVLVEHPWPWRIDKETGELIDIRGRFVIVGDDAILELVAAHVVRSTTQATHSEECWRWHHGCAVARIEALPRAGGDHG